jgi:hypothetical protein
MTSDGATWLDWQMAAGSQAARVGVGFGQEVRNAIHRRAERLVEMGHATARDGTIVVSRNAPTALQRQEVQKVGQKLAADRGLTFMPGRVGEYVTDRLSGVASLASGRFAMIEGGLGFQLVPWQPILDKRTFGDVLCIPKTLNPEVVVMKSAQDGNRPDHTGSLNWARNRRILIQGQVRPCRVIVASVRFQNPAQMFFAQDNDVVHTFTPDRSDQSFDKAILPG